MDKKVERVWIITSIVLFLTVIISLFSVVIAVNLIGVSSGGKEETTDSVIIDDNTKTSVWEETVEEHSTTPPDENIETPTPMTYPETMETPSETVIGDDTNEPVVDVDDPHKESAVLRISYADDTSEVIVCQRTSTAHEIMAYLYTFDNVVSISVFPTNSSE